jgi:hypothetical protein
MIQPLPDDNGWIDLHLHIHLQADELPPKPCTQLMDVLMDLLSCQSLILAFLEPNQFLLNLLHQFWVSLATLRNIVKLANR